MKFPIALANGFKSEAAIVEKVSCGGVATASPERVGKRLARSILRSAGVLPPASTAKVGRMSNMPAIASLAVAAGILQATSDGGDTDAAFPRATFVAAQGRVLRALGIIPRH